MTESSDVTKASNLYLITNWWHTLIERFHHTGHCEKIISMSFYFINWQMLSMRPYCTDEDFIIDRDSCLANDSLLASLQNTVEIQVANENDPVI